MAIFVIGDPHLSLGTDKPMDVFKGWHDYTSRLESNWKSKIKPDDTVVVAGDISWGINLEEAKPDFEFLNSLPGEKILLKGNHDYWWETKTKLENYFQANGFDTLKILFNNHYRYESFGICGTRGWINEKKGEQADKKVLLREAGRLEASIKSALADNLTPVVFLHYPPIYYTEYNFEILEVLHRYGVKKCFYGHIHGAALNFAIDGVVDGIDFRLISADYLKFDPLDITNELK
ncbi:MAG: metallophosphoesterase [Ruminococcus sp.]|nr:metallophosphoesterase [Ruminococcus sp.]